MGKDSARAEEQIIRGFEAYISTVLEVPSPSFGNLPPCPFVHTERAKGRIRYELCSILTDNLPQVRSLVDDFMRGDRYTSLLIIDPGSKTPKEEAVKIGINLCDEIREMGFFAACIHPDDLFQIGDVRTRKPVPHVAILIQSRQLLDWARTKLVHTQYYDRWTQDNIDSVAPQVGP